MKVISSVLFCLMMALCAWAQDAVSEFASRVSSSQTSFSYKMTVEKAGSAKIAGEGTVVLQDASYKVEGNGLEVWCDGNSVWTADVAAREVVIETAAGQGFLNPVSVLSDLRKDFTWDIAPQAASFASVVASKFHLTPVRPGDVTGMDIFFDRQGKKLLGVRLSLKDMTTVTLLLSSVNFSPKNHSLSFKPLPFNDDWIVTDLR